MPDDKILEALSAIKTEHAETNRRLHQIETSLVETNRRLDKIETRLELHTEMTLAITQRLRALETA